MEFAIRRVAKIPTASRIESRPKLAGIKSVGAKLSAYYMDFKISLFQVKPFFARGFAFH